MKKKIIFVVFVMLCLACIIFSGFFIVHNYESDKYMLKNIHNEYISNDETVVAVVNDAIITSQELCLVKYSYQVNNALEQAVEQKAIVQLAEVDGFSLSQSDINNEIDYINEQYEKLNLPDNEDNNAFYDNLIKEHLDMTISIKYKYYIQKQIMRQNFNSTNEAINEKYEEYKIIYKEWEDGDKEDSLLYEKIWSLREEIAEDYIQYRIKELDIVIY